MNILIVDDERIVINGMLSGINWDDFPFENIYTALNSKQAKEIVSEAQVDVVICDIEMPEESGIELLEWIQDKGFDIVSIILTGHANFEYAKKAVELGTVNYLLKPAIFAEIEKQIEKCVKIVQKKQKTNLERINASNWTQNSMKRTEQFYFELLFNLQPTEYSRINDHAKKRGVELPDENRQLLLVLFHIHPLVNGNVLWEQSTLYDELKRIANEVFTDFENVVVPIPADHDLGLVVYLSENAENGEQELKPYCESYINACHKRSKHHISGYIGSPCPLIELQPQLERLLSTENRFGMLEDRIIDLSDAQNSFTYEPIDSGKWEERLINSDIGVICDDVSLYIKERTKRQCLDREVLNRLLQDFIQVIYSVLNKNGIQAHRLFSDEESSLLQKRSFDSIDDYMKWVKYVLTKSSSFIKSLRESQSLMRLLQNYILNNLSEDLSREQLANYSCLHADYLSRLFKKETGVSITEYIMQVRIDKAKQLLRETDEPISNIAGKVGYTNFSYFTACFKKTEKKSPGSYRKQFR